MTETPEPDRHSLCGGGRTGHFGDTMSLSLVEDTEVVQSDSSSDAESSVHGWTFFVYCWYSQRMRVSYSQCEVMDGVGDPQH